MVALLALFISLGGVSYAATTLPAGSVGTVQIRDGAVTGRKLSTATVGLRPLSPQAVLALGAARVRYASAASESAPTRTLLHLGGIKLQGACRRAAPGGTTELVFTITAGQATTLHDSFSADSGTDLHSPGTIQPGTIEFQLPAGTPTQLGGPSADASHFVRTSRPPSS